MDFWWEPLLQFWQNHKDLWTRSDVARNNDIQMLDFFFMKYSWQLLYCVFCPAFLVIISRHHNWIVIVMITFNRCSVCCCCCCCFFLGGGNNYLQLQIIAKTSFYSKNKYICCFRFDWPRRNDIIRMGYRAWLKYANILLLFNNSCLPMYICSKNIKLVLEIKVK